MPSRFEEIAVNAFDQFKQANPKYKQNILISSYLLAIIPGILVCTPLDLLYTKLSSNDSPNPFILMAIYVAVVVLFSIPIRKALLRRNWDSGKFLHKRIVSRFPKDASEDIIREALDGMEEIPVKEPARLFCGKDAVAFLIIGNPITCEVFPADNLKRFGICNRQIQLGNERELPTCESPARAWEVAQEIAKRLGRTDLLTPNVICNAALCIAHEKLIRQVVDLTGLKPAPSMDVFREAKKEVKRRNDDDFEHTIKMIELVYDAIMSVIYYSDEDSAGYYHELNISPLDPKDAPAKELSAYIAANPNAYDVDLVIRCVSAAGSKWLNTLNREFDHFPKAMWEELDLGFGKIVKPFVQNGWKFTE